MTKKHKDFNELCGTVRQRVFNAMLGGMREAQKTLVLEVRASRPDMSPEEYEHVITAINTVVGDTIVNVFPAEAGKVARQNDTELPTLLAKMAARKSSN